MGYLGKQNISFETCLFYQGIAAAIVGATVVFWVDFGFTLNHFFAILNGISFTLADLSYYMLSRSGMSVSTLGPLSSLYVCVPVVLGIALLHEEVTSTKMIGLMSAIAAVYLLSSAEHEHEEEESHTTTEHGMKREIE